MYFHEQKSIPDVSKTDLRPSTMQLILKDCFTGRWGNTIFLDPRWHTSNSEAYNFILGSVTLDVIFTRIILKYKDGVDNVGAARLGTYKKKIRKCSN